MFPALRQLNTALGAARHSTVLVAATFVSHFITLLAAPVISRLYSPAEFGVFATFIALTFLDVAICLGYERAIPFPEDDTTAYAVARLSLLVACCLAALAFVLVVVFEARIAAVLQLGTWSGMLLILPLSMLSMGCIQIGTAIALRHLAFGTVAVGKLLQSTGSSAGQIGLGTLPRIGPFGLILGHVLGLAASVTYLLARARLLSNSVPKEWNLAHAARRYFRFPLLIAPSALMNSLSLQLPILFLNSMYGAAFAGQFALTQRVVGAPMVVVGVSLAQIYLARSAQARRANNPGAERSLLIRTALTQAALGLPLLILTPFAPEAFGFAFGDAWIRAGELYRVLAPLYFIQFVVAPIHVALIVRERHGLYFANELVRLCLIVAVIIWSHFDSLSADRTVLAYSLASGGSYALTGVLCWLAVSRNSFARRKPVQARSKLPAAPSTND